MIALLLAAALFAPPEGRTFRYVIERTIEGTPERRFRLERRVRFVRDGTGMVAEIVLDRTEQSPSDAAAATFAKGQAPFVGRTVRVRLAPDGTVGGVDDAEALFAAMAAAIGPRAAAPLASLPPADRLAMIAAIAEPLVAGEDAAATMGVTRVALASALPGGGPVRLTGTRTVSRAPDGRLTLATHAEGEGVVLDRMRVIDPATGLVLREQETRVVTAGGAAQTSRSIVTVSQYPSADPLSR